MRRILPAAAATSVALCALIALGTWQMQRLRWKTEVLEAIAAAESAPPVPLGADPAPYAKVRAEGVFRPGAALLGAEVRGNALGGRLIALLDRPGQPPVLVDRGWVPRDRVGAPRHPAGRVEIVGYVRPGETAGWFAAPDSLAAREFHTPAPAAIAAAFGAEAVAPFLLVALGPPPPDGPPIPAATLPRPTNNHAAYAATWYGLGAVLVCIFAVWARRAAR